MDRGCDLNALAHGPFLEETGDTSTDLGAEASLTDFTDPEWPWDIFALSHGLFDPDTENDVPTQSLTTTNDPHLITTSQFSAVFGMNSDCLLPDFIAPHAANVAPLFLQPEYFGNLQPHIMSMRAAGDVAPLPTLHSTVGNVPGQCIVHTGWVEDIPMDASADLACGMVMEQENAFNSFDLPSPDIATACELLPVTEPGHCDAIDLYQSMETTEGLPLDLPGAHAYDTRTEMQPAQLHTNVQVTGQTAEPSGRPSPPVEDPSSATQRPSIASIQSQWDLRRSEVEFYYSGKGWKLKDVAELMKKKYGFDASEQMYKKRLRKWGVRKNSSEVQKKAVVKLMAQSARAGTSLAPASVETMRVDPRKVQRYIRERQRRSRVELQDHLDKENDDAVGDTEGEDLETSGDFCRKLLEQSPETRRANILLQCANRYWIACGEMHADARIFYYNDELGDVFNNLENARVELTRNRNQRAFAFLRRGYVAMVPMLRSYPFQLIYEILRLLDLQWWEGQEQIRYGVSRNLLNTVHHELGREHPLSLFVEQSAKHGRFDDIASQLGNLSIDVVQHSHRDIDDEEIANVRGGALQLLIDRTPLDDVPLIHQKFIPEARSLGYKACHRALILCASGLYSCHKYSEAEQLFQEVAFGSALPSDKPQLDPAGIRACAGLGRLYKAQRSFDSSARHFRWALRGCVDRWGEDDVDTLNAVSELESLLEEYGAHEELQRLRERWNPVFVRFYGGEWV